MPRVYDVLGIKVVPVPYDPSTSSCGDTCCFGSEEHLDSCAAAPCLENNMLFRVFSIATPEEVRDAE